MCTIDFNFILCQGIFILSIPYYKSTVVVFSMLILTVVYIVGGKVHFIKKVLTKKNQMLQYKNINIHT